MVDVYHYTDKKGYNAISSQSPYIFKSSAPDKGHPKGVYVTTMSPEQLLHKPGGFKSYLGLTSDKSEYYFKFKIEKCKLKKIKGGRSSHVNYIDHDLIVPRTSVISHGKTDK
ncbi:hypothetical protein ABIC56_000129 [Acinetobacter bereziniae]|nr:MULTISPECIES: HYD1 signature containing ADP-ribosyltransferase family protein [Acinetobacter]ELW78336.1 hypothetical protein ACINWC743_1344 [Acinetobacter sp. WC-743]MDA3440362.1 hypothetical protein [Acinetobacter bereziniae]MDR6542570.1 hypothetical protein [Acinetobacter bereziniae]